LSVNILKFGDGRNGTQSHLFCVSDVSGQISVDPDTMETVGPYKFDDKLGG
jgi:hypothetical protein